ncbi:ig domain-containing protein [Caerostris darwini]|uniref:Ig domain-containing protein n=1 Tax=Caerostris darwini TaxID=1538125 RepID=A0AAV4Q3Z3_9ARAC|nr:ig domain-containing protein [Caerostris darwini]
MVLESSIVHESCHIETRNPRRASFFIFNKTDPRIVHRPRVFLYRNAKSSTGSCADPVFVETIPNVTISIGRDAVLQCSVEDLEYYEVSWIKMDTQTVLTSLKHVVTGDKRIRVTNNNLQWKLHISKVEEKDRGFYMYQINTEPMISQLGYLDVQGNYE